MSFSHLSLLKKKARYATNHPKVICFALSGMNDVNIYHFRTICHFGHKSIFLKFLLQTKQQNMIAKGGYVYIMSNYNRTVLYVGVTSNLYSRAYQHRNGIGSNFSTQYKCKYLVYYEFHDHIASAIEREKNVKKWKREWKLNLIKKLNPNLEDLFDKVGDMQ